MEKKISHSHDYDPALLERMLFKVSKRWVAGYSNIEAINEARKSNKRGMSAILNYLGEGYTEKSQIDRSVLEYFSLLNLLKMNNIRSSISVKPTQIGLCIGYDICLENFGKISQKAKQSGHFMWIDIEHSDFVEDTLSIYLKLFENNRNTGVAIQSYLRRSYSDLLHLMENSANLRIVKGAYSGEKNDAYQSNSEITQNYSRLMNVMLKESSYNGIVAIATHDSNLIDEALALSTTGSIKIKNLQFQLLKGVRDELKKKIVNDGYIVSEYMPYGEKWLQYSLRRLRERKRNIFLLARSLIES
ncbi:MAG TPA: proline dehydrogenase family protein [Nitrososphaeraceae archaeon]|jgi:proline dehydrogenase|nr:proline dehydrogenase family protein [Nitrososphaeraceae archaeon]